MTVVFHSTVDSFLDRAGTLLYGQEAANNLMLGICSHLGVHSSPDSPAILATVDLNGETVSAAVMSGGPLVVTFGSESAIHKLARELNFKKFDFSGVVGPAKEAATFA